MWKGITPKQLASWCASAILGAAFLAGILRAQDTRPLAFFKTGTSTVEDFAAVQPTQAFDVFNISTSYLMLMFEPNANARLMPNIVRLAPHERATVQISAGLKVKSFELRYAVSLSQFPAPFMTYTNRYRAYSDGETVMCIPAPAVLYNAMRARNLFLKIPWF
jgi:hypothetical protein